MILQKLKIMQHIFILGALIFFITPMVSAQNFSNFIPVDVEKDDFIKDQDIEEILKQEQPYLEENLSFSSLESDSQYTLGTMDVLSISVLRHPEVSGDFVINKEGNIQYEFIGDVEVAGKTKKEVSDLLAKLLEKFIIAPEITVKIIGYNSKVVFVVGEVGNPGKIYMRGDTITIHDALIQAGLPLLSAKTSKSRLITPADQGNAKQINVNIHKLLYKGDLRENLVMKPGDTLYVPPTILAKTMRIMQPVAAPIGTGARTGRILTTGF
ncbi:hypothetical protein MNBD_UNCLBAC01-894 [hydrothermal vent metagenome]|uniref:Soluble ligand binding domain-containing protein n=1 Tax=hydrothermal vent metagenome TaxID=652676 RepID=A0A3B1DMP3_9ZZZZ